MKINSKKTKTIAVCGLTAAAITYALTTNHINAEQYVDTTEDAIVLNVDKLSRETVKISLDNFKDIAKSLQLSLKIEGNAKFQEESIKWLINTENANVDIKLSNDNKNLDIFIISDKAIDKDSGIINICEIDVSKADSSSSNVAYKILPNVDDNGVAYNYILDTTNKQVKGSDIVNDSDESLSINTAPSISLKGNSIVEGKIVVLKDSVFNAMDYIVATDDEDGALNNSNVTVDGNVDTKKVGSYTITYTATDSANDKSTLQVTVIVEEVKDEVSNPEIKGADEVIQIKVGEEFDPLNGVTATDYIGRELSIEVSGVPEDLTKVDINTITYKATDIFGNSVIKTRKLIINKPDSPIIEGVRSEVVINQGDTFDPTLGVKAVDYSGKEIEVKVTGNYDLNTPGEYIIKYNAVDSYETKATELETKLIVKAVRKPIITFNNEVINIKVGESADLLSGVTAVDYSDNSLEIKVSNNHDFNKVGKYEITYTVTDKFGNTVTATRTLVVNKQDAPIIEGVRSEVIINQGESFDPTEGVKAVDYSGKEIELKVTGDYDINTPGEYTIKYNAVDSYGTEAIELETKLIVKEIVEDLPEDNKPDDSITEENFEIPNEIKELIDIDIVKPLSGNGTSDNPLLLEVKKVSESTLDNFLNTFKDFNFTVSKINELYEKTKFDIILSKKKSLFNLRSVDDIYMSIIVNNEDKELINTIKNFAGIVDNTGNNEESDSSENQSTDIENNPNNSTENNSNDNEVIDTDKNENSNIPVTGKVIGSSLVVLIGAILVAIGIKINKKK